MAEHIERQAAINAIRKAENHAFNSFYKGLVKAHKIVADLPSADVVPVVRCKDCKYHIVSRQGRLYCIRGFEQTLFSAFSAVDNPIFEREFDSFCSYGERKEEHETD